MRFHPPTGSRSSVVSTERAKLTQVQQASGLMRWPALTTLPAVPDSIAFDDPDALKPERDSQPCSPSISIRAKITAVVAFLLVAMTGMGLLAVRNMRAINASTVDIATNWLPSVRVLGDLRAGVITYRNVIREHMLARDRRGKGGRGKDPGHGRREQHQDSPDL